MNDPQNSTFVIDAAASASSTITGCENHMLVAVQLPAAWTAAGLYFQGYLPLATATPGVIAINGDDVEFASADVSAGGVIQINPPICGCTAIQIVSGAVGSTVNQDAERTIIPRFVPLPPRG